MRCRFFRREKEGINKNQCMAEVAVLGDAGDAYLPSDSEVIDVCLTECFKDCTRFQWVEREKDKEILRHTY